MDVKSAFLNDPLDKEVYVKQSPVSYNLANMRRCTD